jgi:hypothetical protein
MPPPLEAIDDVLDALDGAYGTCLRFRRLAPSQRGGSIEDTEWCISYSRRPSLENPSSRID